MPNFATVEMKEVKGSTQTFEKLYVNNVCFLDEFEKEIKNTSQYYSEYMTIISYMNCVANGQKLPDTKFKILKGGKKGVTRFEFKSKNLRIYGIGNPGGKLVIMGGFKNDQKSDIRRFDNLIKDYDKHLQKITKDEQRRIANK